MSLSPETFSLISDAHLALCDKLASKIENPDAALQANPKFQAVQRLYTAGNQSSGTGLRDSANLAFQDSMRAGEQKDISLCTAMLELALDILPKEDVFSALPLNRVKVDAMVEIAATPALSVYGATLRAALQDRKTKNAGGGLKPS